MIRLCFYTLMFAGCAALALSGCKKEAPQKAASAGAGAVSGRQGQPLDGAQLFNQYCASCHPDGGNVNDPKRNLHSSALRASRITTPEDVVRVMRNPVSRMIRFDAAMLPDAEARAIAEYVLKAFK